MNKEVLNKAKALDSKIDYCICIGNTFTSAGRPAGKGHSALFF